MDLGISAFGRIRGRWNMDHVTDKLAAPTPNDLLALAVSKGADVDQLGKLMELQLRWEANEARKAWVEAMAAFKLDAPKILKTKHVQQPPAKDGTKRAEYWHAELDKVCCAIIEGLNKHGLQHRWEREEQTPAWISISCVIQHKLGHFEKTTIGGPPDQTGSKNSVQAVGSSVTYLQRYTLLAATGLAAENQDTDGKAPILPLDRITEQCEWIASARNAEELMRIWKNAHEEAATVRDYNAVRIILEAKDRRKDELFGGSL